MVVATVADMVLLTQHKLQEQMDLVVVVVVLNDLLLVLAALAGLE